jgi:Tol biopolymer transport system component
MKTLQNNFTTTEQSKGLLKLGVPADSADCYYLDLGLGEYSDKPYCGFNADEFPCWSVGRLNEIFKICSDNQIEIYDLDLKGTQIERAMQAFENYAKYNWLDFSKLED